MVREEFEHRGYILVSKEYINNSSKLEYICPHHKDKGVQEITFGNFTSGKGCPYCAKVKRKTTEDYIKELSSIKPNIEVLDEYVNLRTKIKHKCKICDYIWGVRPDILLYNKNGCPKCGKRAVLTQKEFVEKVEEINSNILVLDDYIKSSVKISFCCKICGNVWKAKPNNILQGKGCPKCKCSKGELAIAKFLDGHKVDYVCQKTFEDCKKENLLPFDFYIDSLNLCIEYDGIQHFIPCTFGGISKEEAIEKFESCKVRDKIKTDFCKSHGINLLRIPYFHYDRIEEIINSILS